MAQIEYTVKDAIGSHGSCGTIQVDFFYSQARLGAEYVMRR